MDLRRLQEPYERHAVPVLFRFGALTGLIFILSFSSCAANHQLAGKKAMAEAALGVALVQQGQSRAGLEHLLNASRLDPKNPRILEEVALIYRDIKQYPLSLKYFKKALALQPDFPSAWNNLGTVYLLLKEYDLAIPCFKRAAQALTYKTPHFAYNNLGLAYFYKGEYQKAITSYQQAVSLAPDYSLCWDNLGMAYEAVGDQTEARKAFETAIKYAPGFAAAHFHLAKLYLRVNQSEKAREELKETIRLSPQGPLADEAKNLLSKMP